MTHLHAAFGRLRAVPAMLALVLATAVIPAAGAQDTQTVQVTASVDSFLTLSLCDLSADFGSGLSAIGATPRNTTDVAVATSEGPNSGEGVFYRWTPSCQSDGTGNFITVESNGTWQFVVCGTPNAGSNPDLTLNDLYWSDAEYTDYDQLQFGRSFATCPSSSAASPVIEGNHDRRVFYYLRIDDDVADGSFAVLTTWQVVAA